MEHLSGCEQALFISAPCTCREILIEQEQEQHSKQIKQLRKEVDRLEKDNNKLKQRIADLLIPLKRTKHPRKK